MPPNKHDAHGFYFDSDSGIWQPQERGIQAWDLHYAAYKPVLGVLGNKSPLPGYTRLAMNFVDGNGNALGIGEGSKPIQLRNGRFWSEDILNGLSGREEILLNSATNASGFTLVYAYGANYWYHIDYIQVSNASATNAWLLAEQYPTTRPSAVVSRFWAPANDTRLYRGTPLIISSIGNYPRLLLRAESNVDSLYITTLHWQGIYTS